MNAHPACLRVPAETYRLLFDLRHDIAAWSAAGNEAPSIEFVGFDNFIALNFSSDEAAAIFRLRWL